MVTFSPIVVCRGSSVRPSASPADDIRFCIRPRAISLSSSDALSVNSQSHSYLILTNIFNWNYCLFIFWVIQHSWLELAELWKYLKWMIPMIVVMKWKLMCLALFLRIKTKIFCLRTESLWSIERIIGIILSLYQYYC